MARPMESTEYRVIDERNSWEDAAKRAWQAASKTLPTSHREVVKQDLKVEEASRGYRTG